MGVRIVLQSRVDLFSVHSLGQALSVVQLVPFPASHAPLLLGEALETILATRLAVGGGGEEVALVAGVTEVGVGTGGTVGRAGVAVESLIERPDVVAFSAFIAVMRADRVIFQKTIVDCRHARSSFSSNIP